MKLPSSFEKEKLFGGTLFLLAVVAVLRVFWTSWDLGVHDGEMLSRFSRTALRWGIAPSTQDFFNSFDVWGFDGDSRPRFLSHLLMTISQKTRLMLWPWIPMHPTWTPVWALSLILGPVLLYKFLQGEFGRTAALFGCSLYMVSPGYLFPLHLYFHPGKTLVGLAVIYSLWASREAVGRGRWTRAECAHLAVVWTLFGFVDETAWFGLAAVLIWGGKALFWRKSPLVFAWNALPAMIAAAAFLWVVLVKAPQYSAQFYTDRVFDFFGGLKGGTFQKFHELTLSSLLQRVGETLASYTVPWAWADLPCQPGREMGDSIPGSVQNALMIIAGAGLFLAGASALFRPRIRKPLLLVAGGLGFAIWALSHHSLWLTAVGFHYAAYIPVLFAIMLAAWVAESGPTWRIFGLTCALMGVQLLNFTDFSAAWRIHAVEKTDFSDLEKFIGSKGLAVSVPRLTYTGKCYERSLAPAPLDPGVSSKWVAELRAKVVHKQPLPTKVPSPQLGWAVFEAAYILEAQTKAQAEPK